MVCRSCTGLLSGMRSCMQKQPGVIQSNIGRALGTKMANTNITVTATYQKKKKHNIATEIKLLQCLAYTPPFAYKPPLHIQLKFLHRYFYLANRPPNHGHATKIAFIETPSLSSSRSPWWSGNARTKPASTEQLRNSPTITRVFTSGVNATVH